MEYLAGSTKEGFAKLDSLHHFDAVLLGLIPGFALAGSLMESGQWQFTYGDLHRILLVRKASPFAADLPPETPAYLQPGDDLAGLVAAYPAVMWSGFLSQGPDPALMNAFLETISKAEEIPTPLLQNSGSYGLKHRNEEVMRLVRRMSMRRRSYSKSEEEAFNRLLLQFPP